MNKCTNKVVITKKYPQIKFVFPTAHVAKLRQIMKGANGLALFCVSVQLVGAYTKMYSYHIIYLIQLTLYA